MNHPFKRFAALLAALLLAGCAANDPAETTVPSGPVAIPPRESSPAQVTRPTEPEGYLEIDTPYCVLYFPERWEDVLSVNAYADSGYHVEFSGRTEGGEPRRLFDVTFDTGEGDLLGTVETGDGTSRVYIRFYEPDSEGLSQTAYDSLLAMQESANELIARLPLADPEPEQPEFLTIETEWGDLRYSAKWEDTLAVKQGGDTVSFLAVTREGEIELFHVVFSDDPDGALGSLEGKWVHVLMEELPQLAGETADLVYGMQDGVNDLIDGLYESME